MVIRYCPTWAIFFLCFLSRSDAEALMTNSARSLMQTAWSYRMSRVLLSGFDLGVFTALSRGPRTSASLAQGLRLDARGLDRL
jgi:hypothetical protein